MAKNQNQSCCTPTNHAAGSFKVESIIPIDERGQMVLPKELREKAGIRGGDKLAVVTWNKEGKVCCISLIKADELAGIVKDFLGSLTALTQE